MHTPFHKKTLNLMLRSMYHTPVISEEIQIKRQIKINVSLKMSASSMITKNTNDASEEKDESFEPGSKSSLKPTELLKKGCAQEIIAQLSISVEVNSQTMVCQLGRLLPKNA